MKTDELMQKVDDFGIQRFRMGHATASADSEEHSEAGEKARLELEAIRAALLAAEQRERELVEALRNLTALARPHFSDDVQMVALRAADAALAAHRPAGVEVKGCPSCGAREVDSMTPQTVYACGSKDYDQRPGTFVAGEDCRPTGER